MWQAVARLAASVFPKLPVLLSLVVFGTLWKVLAFKVARPSWLIEVM